MSISHRSKILNLPTSLKIKRMACDKLIHFLDDNRVKYITITHSQAFTAQQVAASAHIKGKNLAKTVMVKILDRLAMVVLPADRHVDFHLLKEITGSENVMLARESEFRDLFPDCELGAMPPFGNLYGLDVYVSERLSLDEEIAFNAGNHAELIRMSYKDFETLVKPKILKFTMV
jgi:Ala-tRNA(Pro) deacylase